VPQRDYDALVVLFFVAVWAGIQNALAAAVPFSPAGADVHWHDGAVANITSTVALFPAR